MFERINADPGISFKYVNAEDQIADMWTKGSFTTVYRDILGDLAQNRSSNTFTSARRNPKARQTFYPTPIPRIDMVVILTASVAAA